MRVLIDWLERRYGLLHPVQVSGHPHLASALAAFESRDWMALEGLLAGQSPDGAVRLLIALGAASALDEPIGDLPTRRVPRVAIGAVFVGWAWRYRGFDGAATVSEAAWDAFFDRLGLATSALLSALEDDPTDGVALSFLIRAATGSQDLALLADAKRAFLTNEVRPLEGTAWLMQACGAKWHGSHDEMNAVTDRLANDDAIHPARIGLKARNLIERWLYDAFMGEDHRAAFQAKQLFGLPGTRELIAKLHDDYERLMSVWPADEADPFAEAFAHDNIGMAAYQASAFSVARPHVEALGFMPSEWPWVYVLGARFSNARWIRLRREVRTGRG